MHWLSYVMNMWNFRTIVKMFNIIIINLVTFLVLLGVSMALTSLFTDLSLIRRRRCSDVAKDSFPWMCRLWLAQITRFSISPHVGQAQHMIVACTATLLWRANLKMETWQGYYWQIPAILVWGKGSNHLCKLFSFYLVFCHTSGTYLHLYVIRILSKNENTIAGT